MPTLQKHSPCVVSSHGVLDEIEEAQTENAHVFHANACTPIWLWVFLLVLVFSNKECGVSRAISYRTSASTYAHIVVGSGIGKPSSFMPSR